MRSQMKQVILVGLFYVKDLVFLCLQTILQPDHDVTSKIILHSLPGILFWLPNSLTLIGQIYFYSNLKSSSSAGSPNSERYNVTGKSSLLIPSKNCRIFWGGGEFIFHFISKCSSACFIMSCYFPLACLTWRNSFQKFFKFVRSKVSCQVFSCSCLAFFFFFYKIHKIKAHYR